MSTIAEIEAAIENLPRPQVDELAAWLERFRAAKEAVAPIEAWLAEARGAARLGVSTEAILAETRGNE